MLIVFQFSAHTIFLAILFFMLCLLALFIEPQANLQELLSKFLLVLIIKVECDIFSLNYLINFSLVAVILHFILHALTMPIAPILIKIDFFRIHIFVDAIIIASSLPIFRFYFVKAILALKKVKFASYFFIFAKEKHPRTI